VFNATFKNISVISFKSVLLVERTGVPGENHRPVASVSFIGGENGSTRRKPPTCRKSLVHYYLAREEMKTRNILMW